MTLGRTDKSPVNRGGYIAHLAQVHDWRIGAELGVKEGRTLETILEQTPCFMYAVDLWKPLKNDLESYDGWDFEAFEQSVKKIATRYSNRVAMMKKSTHEASLHIQDGALDFVFIDADHTYEGVSRDILDWTPKVRAGGYIIGHDWDWPSVRQAAEEAFKYIETGPDNLWISRSPV